MNFSLMIAAQLYKESPLEEGGDVCTSSLERDRGNPGLRLARAKTSIIFGEDLTNLRLKQRSNIFRPWKIKTSTFFVEANPQMRESAGADSRSYMERLNVTGSHDVEAGNNHALGPSTGNGNYIFLQHALNILNSALFFRRTRHSLKLNIHNRILYCSRRTQVSIVEAGCKRKTLTNAGRLGREMAARVLNSTRLLSSQLSA